MFALPLVQHPTPSISTHTSLSRIQSKSVFSIPATPEESCNPVKSGLKLTSSSSTGSLRRNKISFGDTSTLVYEKEIDNEDEEHKNAVWYSQKEIKAIRKDLKKSIKKGEITRGLERFEGDMGAERTLHRLDHIASILDLHHEQQEKGIDDGKSLEMLSRAMSADDLRRARRLASLDSKDAFQEYQSTESTIIRSTSKTALDNFRKSLPPRFRDLRGSRAICNATIGSFTSTKSRSQGNATFGNKSVKKPNMLLQALEDKMKLNNIDKHNSDNGSTVPDKCVLHDC